MGVLRDRMIEEMKLRNFSTATMVRRPSFYELLDCFLVILLNRYRILYPRHSAKSVQTSPPRWQ